MVVQHNINAMTAYNKLNVNVTGLKKSSEKLASGYRINRAGDDAAGLAISEKMRSQIKGLNQAVRNSQDGINMIQTFEGAATNTHEILQRMKVLAEESANGNYQNEVDREALQLEFDSLNDELNQIADTDFNGVVMLNGGVMADGLKAVNGKFDYANKTRDPMALTKADITVLGYEAFNDTDTTDGVTKADTVWKNLNDNWDRSDKDHTNDGPESVDIKLKYDATSNTWSIASMSNGAKADGITINMNDGDANGGFSLEAGGVTFANVVLDQTSLVNGDEITLTLKNPTAKVSAPTNADVDTVKNSDPATFTEGTDKDAIKFQDANLTVTIADDLDDAAMTDAVKSVLDALQGAQVSVTYTANDNAKINNNNLSITLNGASADIKAAQDGDGTITLDDGTSVYFKVGENGDEITLYAGEDADTGVKIGTIKATTQKSATGGSSGTVTYTVGVNNASYDTSNLPTVEVKDPGTSAVSKSNSFQAATAPLTYSDHLILQTGARTKDSVDFTFTYSTEGMGNLKSNLNMSSRADGLNTANLTLTTQKDANYAIDQINNAINKVSMIRATFGATQNRLEYKIDNLTTTATNVQEAESAIRDTDMAQEMMNYTKYSILQQAAQSMLAQANQQPQGILQLLG